MSRDFHVIIISPGRDAEEYQRLPILQNTGVEVVTSWYADIEYDTDPLTYIIAKRH